MKILFLALLSALLRKQHSKYLPFFGFLRQSFSVALEAVLELALVYQAGLELTEIRLPLPPECWD